MYLWAKATEIVKMRSYNAQLIKTLMLHTANVAITVGFVLGEKQWIKSHARNRDWS